jgi:outer membrane receptor for ferrienterochelin and colicins
MKIRLLFFCLLVSGSLKAQTYLLEDAFHQPMIGLSVAFRAVSDQQTYTFLSDSSGKVHYNGTYPVQILLHSLECKLQSDSFLLTPQERSIVVSKKVNGVLPEATVSAKLLLTSKQDIIAVEQITKKQIEQSAATNIGDLLKLKAGIQISNDGLLGSAIKLNGLSAQYVKILIDGVPINGRMNGAIDLSQIPVQNIQRIEIIRGPMSVLYGSDAIGGVINIITSHALKHKWNGSIETYYDPVANYNIGFSGTRVFKKTLLTISAGRNFFDGWSLKDTCRHQTWKPKESYTGQLKLTQSFMKSSINFQSTFLKERLYNLGNTTISPYAAYAFDEQFNTLRIQNNLQWNYHFNSQHHLTANTYYTYYTRIKNTYRKDMVSLKQQVLSDEALNDTTKMTEKSIHLKYVFNAVKQNWIVLIGNELLAENASGKRVISSKQYYNNGLYAAMIYQFSNRLKISPAVRYTVATDYGTALNPQLNVCYELKKHQLEGNISRAFRAPSLKERYLLFIDNNHDVQGNPNLKAEQAWYASFQYTNKIVSTSTQIEWSGRLFKTTIKNAIVLAQSNISPTLYTYSNTAQINTNGIGMDFQLRRKKFGLQNSFNLNYQKNQIELNGTLPYNKFVENSTNVNYSFSKIALEGTLQYKYTGQQEIYIDNGAQLLKSVRPAYSWLDAFVSKSFLSNGVLVSTGVKNVFNVTTLNSSITSNGAHSDSGIALLGNGRIFFVKLIFHLHHA